MQENFEQDVSSVYKTLKNESNKKEIFWSNLQRNLDHDFDPTTFNFLNMLKKDYTAAIRDNAAD